MKSASRWFHYTDNTGFSQPHTCCFRMTVINYMTSLLRCRFWYAAWKNRPHRTYKNKPSDITFVCPTLHSATLAAHGILSDNYPLWVHSKSTRRYAVLMFDPVVTIRTTRFNIQQFAVLPTQCTCFARIIEETAIISLYSIN
jgi:hypothetical protein